MNNKVLYILFFITHLMSLHANEEKSNLFKHDLTVPEFSVTLEDFTIRIDNLYNDALNYLVDIFNTDGKLQEYGWNIKGASFQDIEITYVDGFSDKWIYSIIINEPWIDSIRGISVGDNISEVYSLINALSQFDIYILTRDSSVIIQKMFLWEDDNEGDNLESYEGEPNKTYSLSYYFNIETNLIEKIIMNRAYSL